MLSLSCKLVLLNHSTLHLDIKITQYGQYSYGSQINPAEFQLS